MAKAFDEWDKLAALNDPGEWVIGYALLLYRRFKLPDEDGFWAYSEVLAVANPPCTLSPPSPQECADVRVTGALATAVAKMSPPGANAQQHASSITHDSYGFYLARGNPPGEETVDASFVRLYMAHFRPLVGMAVLLILDTGAAEAIVRESFLSLHATRSWLAHGEDRALAYLCQNVVNRSRSVLRYREVTKQTILSLPSHGTQFPSAGGGAFDLSGRSAVIAAIQSLPARQREALVLHYYGDLPTSAIAEIMGVSKGAVRSLITQAVASLARNLPQSQNNTDPR
jgi:RNA polymerase sigma factor (sigma-70 family)